MPGALATIHHIKGIMDQKVYKQILIHHMRPSLLQFGGKDHIIFQQDNDPKLTAKSVENYISIGNYTVREVLMKNRTSVWRNVYNTASA